MTWRTETTAVVGKDFTRDWDLLATHLAPREVVHVAARPNIFMLNGAEWGMVPLFVTSQRFVAGKETFFSGKVKRTRQVKLADIRRFGGGPMLGVGPSWECIVDGSFGDLRILFSDLLEGERFTIEVQRRAPM